MTSTQPSGAHRRRPQVSEPPRIPAHLASDTAPPTSYPTGPLPGPKNAQKPLLSCRPSQNPVPLGPSWTRVGAAGRGLLIHLDPQVHSGHFLHH